MTLGQVCVDGDIVDVKYRFIDEDTIECTDLVTGCIFFTHYKSIVDQSYRKLKTC